MRLMYMEKHRYSHFVYFWVSYAAKHRLYDHTSSYTDYGNCVVRQPVRQFGKEFNSAYVTELLSYQPEHLRKSRFYDDIYEPGCDITIISFMPATKDMLTDLNKFDAQKWLYFVQKNIREKAAAGPREYSKELPKLMTDQRFHELEMLYDR